MLACAAFESRVQVMVLGLEAQQGNTFPGKSCKLSLKLFFQPQILTKIKYFRDKQKEGIQINVGNRTVEDGVQGCEHRI